MYLLLVVLDFLLQILNLLLKFSIQSIHLFKQSVFTGGYPAVIAGIGALSKPIELTLPVLLQLIDFGRKQFIFLLKGMNLIDSRLFLETLGNRLLAYNGSLIRLPGFNLDPHRIISTGPVTEQGITIYRAFENISLQRQGQ
jgi:hypothetical protein